MTQPAPYVPAYSFTGYQRVNPTSPLPGDKLDANNLLLKDTLDEILANLALIQRDDGEVANQTIGIEQLKPELRSSTGLAEAWELVEFTLTANQSTTTLTNDRLDPTSRVLFDAVTANAKAEEDSGTRLVLAADRQSGQWVVTHANNPQTDRTYYVHIE